MGVPCWKQHRNNVSRIPLSFYQIGMMVVKNMAPINNVNKIMGVKIFQTGHSA